MKPYAAIIALLVVLTNPACKSYEEDHGSVAVTNTRQKVSVAMREGSVQLLWESSSYPIEDPKATLTRIWTSKKNGTDRVTFYAEHFKSTRVLELQIPGTYLALLVVDGKPTSFLLDRDGYRKCDVWEIVGLPNMAHFVLANHIQPDLCSVRIVRPMADLTISWVLDFSAPEKGLVVRYEYAGGW